MNRRELILNHLRRIHTAKQEAEAQQRRADLAAALVEKMQENEVIFGLTEDRDFVIITKRLSETIH